MMNRAALIAILTIAFANLFAQSDARSFHEQAMQKANEGKYAEAIALLDQSIALDPGEYAAWYNRGVCKNNLRFHERALADFDEALRLNPDYNKALLNRGIAKRYLTDYDGAKADYTTCIQRDSTYSEAYYNRGLIHELFEARDSACADFDWSKRLHYQGAEKKADKCFDTVSAIKKHSVLYLTKNASNKDYGYSSRHPVKVGTGPSGGPSNQRDYLNLLRDPQGLPVSYTMLRSCCPYKSPNGFLGAAMLDEYQLTYRDAKGEEKTTSIYISFYDYEEPMIPAGFKTVGQ